MTTAIGFHDRLAKQWRAKYRHASFARRADALMAAVDRFGQGPGRWLDAGCGAGVLTQRLARRGHEVVGVDASAEMIRAAVRASRQWDEPARLRTSFDVVPTIEKLPWEGAAFDGVLCSSVIEYLEEPEASMAEFARVLRPNGRLVVSVPNRWGLVRNVQKICYAATARLTQKPWPPYLRYSGNDYTLRSFTGLLASAGFEVAQALFYDPLMPGRLARLYGSLLIVSARSTLKRESPLAASIPP